MLVGRRYDLALMLGVHPSVADTGQLPIVVARLTDFAEQNDYQPIWWGVNTDILLPDGFVAMTAVCLPIGAMN